MTPGPQMLFVMTQAAWRGPRAGAAALAGLQLGNALWFVMAALGLGALATSWPKAFTGLTAAGALYLAWLGVKALRHAGSTPTADDARPRPPASRHALRDSLVVSLSNPKSLVYVVALLPPFIDPARPVAAQFALLGATAIAIDFTIGLVYVAAGGGLADAMNRLSVRTALERAIGIIFVLLAAAILLELVLRDRVSG